jgi:exopolyphosphatase/guanosine-5'-triphosphate,3'-diphosphate pyrophosphatase
MCDAMTAFNLLMKVHKVQSYRAFATPLCEAYNGQEIVALIKEKSDVNIEIIDGKKGGGKLLDLLHLLNKDQNYLCRCWWRKH